MNDYIAFLKLFNAFTSSKEDLDSYLIELLNAIAIYNDTHEVPIRCSDLIIRQDLGSPATIHKNYHFLIKRGYLEHSFNPDDGRLKYIELTDKSRQFYGKLEEYMKRSVGFTKK